MYTFICWHLHLSDHKEFPVYKTQHTCTLDVGGQKIISRKRENGRVEKIEFCPFLVLLVNYMYDTYNMEIRIVIIVRIPSYSQIRYTFLLFSYTEHQMKHHFFIKINHI